MSCGVTDVAVNQELRIAFSQPLDITSVNNNTFQVQDPLGLTPPGEFLLDPNDASILIYRPSLTFDSSGNPVFGLEQNSSYTIFVPGKSSDTGPYIRSLNGNENSKRLFCTLSTPFDPIDLNPGPPAVETNVDVVTGYDANGDPETFDLDVPAIGAVNVYRDSPIRFTFSDVMNPGTLVNPVSGASPNLRVFVDGDGSTATTSDQVPIEGDYTLSIDSQALTTSVTFTPALGYPSAGNDESAPRRIVVAFGATIADLGGNTLSNGGLLTFVPESVTFPPVRVTEDFSSDGGSDLLRSGAEWAAPDSLGGQSLQPGVGGGSGIHGDLSIPAQRTVVLSTDSEDFSGITDQNVYNPATQIRNADTQAPLVVNDGLFEFASLEIAQGGQLRFVGSNPARVFVRGQCRVTGTINLAGASAADHAGVECDGGLGGVPGPGGGAGGDGGDRPGTAAFANVPDVGDIVTPEAPSPACAPMTLYDDVNGKPGVGILVPNTLSPLDSVGEGEGGLAWPQPVTAEGWDFPTGPEDIDPNTDMDLYSALFSCAIRASGSPGGGAAHALSGQVADLRQPGPAADGPEPPSAAGGDAVALGIGAAEMTLDPLQGYLRGGAGGGGGGGHLQDTRLDGFFTDCLGVLGDSEPSSIVEYVASSSAGGGGGGGGMQLQAGRSIAVTGIIDASGGSGGSGVDVPVGFDQSPPSAMGGGGGSGGSVLLQSRSVDLSQTPGRIELTGGDGGTTETAAGSRGGSGGPGLLRIETIPIRPVTDYAPQDCVSSVGCLDEFFSNSPVFPDPDLLLNPLQLPTGDIADLFTTAEWQSAASGSGRVSGGMSCWLQPDGNYFVLDFLEDEVDGTGQITVPAWDLEVKLASAPTTVSYRTPNVLFPGVSVEQLVSQLGFPPVSVRFQGARTLEPLVNPCDVDLAGLESPLFPGSVTGWVEHPADLNDFFEGDPTRRPNTFRFVVIFDTRDQSASTFEFVDDVSITVRPD